MNVGFLDANIFIRYLTNDDPAKADRVEKLLDQAAEGKKQLARIKTIHRLEP